MLYLKKDCERHDANKLYILQVVDYILLKNVTPFLQANWKKNDPLFWLLKKNSDPPKRWEAPPQTVINDKSLTTTLFWKAQKVESSALFSQKQCWNPWTIVCVQFSYKRQKVYLQFRFFICLACDECRLAETMQSYIPSLSTSLVSPSFG